MGVNCGQSFICRIGPWTGLGRKAAGCVRALPLSTVVGMESDATSAADTRATPKVPLLQLVTRSGCHLCENAREVVATVAGQLQLRWTEVSLDDHPELTERYGEEVPVVLVNGIQRDFWHIDPIRLGNILSQALTGG